MIKATTEKKTKSHHVRIKVEKVPTFGEKAPVQLKGAMGECRIDQYIFHKKMLYILFTYT